MNTVCEFDSYDCLEFSYDDIGATERKQYAKEL